MSRKRVNLRALPVWIQYLIAIPIVAFVFAAAWFVGRSEPIPLWITEYLVPLLGVLYIILLLVVVIRRILGKKD